MFGDAKRDAGALGAPTVVLATPSSTVGAGVSTVALVELRDDGSTWFNGVLMPDDRSLRATARGAVATTPHLTAEIRAGSAVVYARVIAVMDLLRREGITDVVLGVAGPTHT